MPVDAIAYGAVATDKPLVPIKYQIRDCEELDVQIEVHYCGICHSDIHAARGEWGSPLLPLVPGHEFTGIVTATGSGVAKHKVGDRVGVGCRVSSCRECRECKRDWENYCLKVVRTYNSLDHTGKPTWGGYGSMVVVPEHFVFSVPDALPLDRAAPLLCAGITMWSPMVYNNLDKGGKRVGVIGLGGLGHMAVQLAASMGNEVTVISRSTSKAELAKQLGAKHVLISTDQAAMAAAKMTFDYIFDTVSAQKPVDQYASLLDCEGKLVMVGLPPASDKLVLPAAPLIMMRRSIQGSVIGGVRETQEMLNFCAEKQILPHIEHASCDQVNECYERVVKGDVKFRFVLDVKNTKPTNAEVVVPF